ncbi:MAG: nicotinamide riboside transporter PnuC [Gammaproteobacteria bacterium]|nr:nicotinamide riboside transporter PnuC [Gammaproteobacteria bacterium]NNM20645.1 nicotinamide mononucleotide transporter [Gammaproteobacteria bacterium]
MEWVEPVAAFFGLLAVILVVRQNVWCWPTGLVQVSLYVFVFFQAKLYSDFLLHLIYVAVQLYGWYHWLHGGANQGELRVSRLDRNALLGWIGAATVGTLGWGYLMSATTDAAIPYGDAFTTAASLVAMWLQARKRIETWHFWIVVDIVAIGIYYVKELYWTAGLYAVFLGLCVAGYIAWNRSLQEQQAAA